MTKPEKVYKYQSLTQYSLRNLKNNHIYFNSPSNFNDPFDTFQAVKFKDLSKKQMKDSFWESEKDRLPFELMEKGLATYDDSKAIFLFFLKSMKSFSFILKKKLNINITGTGEISWEEAIKKANSQNELQKAICSSFYYSFNDIVKVAMKTIKEQGMYDASVSCFCEENNNMLMWSHYGDSHKGFCLEFDTSYDPFTKMFPVTYSKDIPEIDLNSLINNSENNLDTIKANLLHKYIDWEYEKEWRILHQEKTTSFCYKTNALTGVYFGTKIDFSDLEILATIVKGQHSKCKFYVMDKDDGAFKVTPRLVNYSTFSEAKSVVASNVSQLLNKGERDLDNLLEKVSIKLPEKQLKTILEAILDDIKKST